MPSLRFEDDEGEPTTVVLGAADVLIGRLEECAIRTASSTVTRRHAVIRPCDGGYEITDCESDNGTYVDLVRIRDPRRLHDGDEVRCGTLVLRYTESSETEPR